MSYEKLGFTSGQLLKADHLNHIEDGFENISWNDLTDKPFGETLGKGENAHTPLTTASSLEQWGNAFRQKIGARWAPKAGDTYFVTWDGVEYICTASAGAIGNSAIKDGTNNGDENDYPFLITATENDYGVVSGYLYCKDNQTHTIEVYMLVTKYDTISPNYLPKVAGMAIISHAPTADDFNALLNALKDAGYMKNA